MQKDEDRNLVSNRLLAEAFAYILTGTFLFYLKQFV